MKIKGRVNRKKTTNFSAHDKSVDHLRQRNVRKTITIVCEENFIVFDQMPYRQKSLTDVTPNASVDQRNSPVWRIFTNNFDLLTVICYSTIPVCPSICV